MQLYPDQLRGLGFMEIPPGFQRENIRAELASDGVTVNYAYQDVQKTWAMQHPGIVRVKGRVFMQRQSLFTGAQTIAALTPRLRAGANAVGAILGPVAKGFFGFGGFGGGANAVAAIANNENVMCPTRMVGLEAEVWGRRTTTMLNLFNALQRILVLVNFPELLADTTIDYDLHFPDRYASMRTIVRVPAGAALGAALGEQIGNNFLGHAKDLDVWNKMFAPGTGGDILVQDLWATLNIPQTSAAVPADSTRARSDALSLLVSQVLGDSCALPLNRNAQPPPLPVGIAAPVYGKTWEN
jgi:hypothetical protein